MSEGSIGGKTSYRGRIHEAIFPKNTWKTRKQLKSEKKSLTGYNAK